MDRTLAHIQPSEKLTRAAALRFKQAQRNVEQGHTVLCPCGRPANYKLGRCYIILADKRRVPIPQVCSTTCAEREKHKALKGQQSHDAPNPNK